jgi:hypothetical protein
MKRKVWWHDCKFDIEQYVKTCSTCQAVKGHKTRPVDFRATRGDGPFTHVAMDLFGPLPVASKGHKYMLVIQGTFSKFVEFVPLTRADAHNLPKLSSNDLSPGMALTKNGYRTMVPIHFHIHPSPFEETRYLPKIHPTVCSPGKRASRTNDVSIAKYDHIILVRRGVGRTL